MPVMIQDLYPEAGGRAGNCLPYSSHPENSQGLSIEIGPEKSLACGSLPQSILHPLLRVYQRAGGGDHQSPGKTRYGLIGGTGSIRTNYSCLCQRSYIYVVITRGRYTYCAQPGKSFQYSGIYFFSAGDENAALVA